MLENTNYLNSLPESWPILFNLMTNGRGKNWFEDIEEGSGIPIRTKYNAM